MTGAYKITIQPCERGATGEQNPVKRLTAGVANDGDDSALSVTILHADTTQIAYLKRFMAMVNAGQSTSGVGGQIDLDFL